VACNILILYLKSAQSKQAYTQIWKKRPCRESADGRWKTTQTKLWSAAMLLTSNQKEDEGEHVSIRIQGAEYSTIYKIYPGKDCEGKA